MAFRYEEAAKLQKLAFLPNVWNFMIDLIVVQAKFGALQLTGFVALFIFYTYELVSFYCCSQNLKVDEAEGDYNLEGKENFQRVSDDKINIE